MIQIAGLVHALIDKQLRKESNMKTILKLQRALQALLITGISISALATAHAEEPQKEAGKVSLMTQVPPLTPISDYQGTDWRTSTSAFGFDGIGASRQQLYEKGIAIDIGMTNVVQGVVSGGNDTKWAYTNIMDQQISLDTGRLDWWPGGLIVIHGRSKLGKDVFSAAGTISPVNHTALTPVAREVNKWFLEEYYLLQGLSEKLSFIAGRVMFSGIGDLNRFAGNEKTQFLNTSLRNSPLLGMIEEGQVVGDIIHVTDLYTTFARLGDAMKYIPTDRVVDGLDQTSLILNGDTHSRRDYVFIYSGHEIGATVKGRYKRHWIGAGDVAASGMPEAYFDLYQDPREENPQLVPLIHTQGQFNRMLARHELFKNKYPDVSNAHGIPYTGLSNARPETKAIADRVKRNIENMPFDIKEYLEFDVPGSDSVGDWGH